MSDKQKLHLELLAERKESVRLILHRYEGDALWDSIKAKDVDPQILEHIQAEVEMGIPMSKIRADLGIKSPTAKSWVKISAALKAGWRIDTAGLFVRMMGRQENMAAKIYKILDQVLDCDVESLKIRDKKGVSRLNYFAKDVTGMIDALGRLHQGTVKIGQDLGVFQDAGEKGGGGSSPTIIINNNVPLPPVVYAKKKPDVIDVEKS